MWLSISFRRDGKTRQTKVGDPTEVADTEDIEEAVDGHQDGKLC